MKSLSERPTTTTTTEEPTSTEELTTTTSAGTPAETVANEITKEEQNDIYAKQHRPTEEPKPEVEQSDKELEEIFSKRMNIRNHGCKYQSVIADVMDDPLSGLDDLIKVHRAIFNLETIEDKELRLVFF